MFAMSLLALFVAPPLVAASAADVRFRIIPDIAVLALLGIGLVSALLAGAVLPALLAGAAGLGLGFGLWWLGAWGMGDAKLLGAAGLLAGPDGFPMLLLVMALAGGAMAAVLLWLSSRARRGCLAVAATAPHWVRVEVRRLRLAPSLPYGLAIAAGLFAALLGKG